MLPTFQSGHCLSFCRVNLVDALLFFGRMALAARNVPCVTIA